MRFGSLSVLTIWAFVCAGCAIVQPTGMYVDAASQVRVDQAVARLGIEGAVRAAVTNDRRPNAHAWRDGRIEVTRGLVGLLDDDELAAAIAHERGHLLAQHSPGSLAALDGCRRDMAGEFAADSLGCKLMEDNGLRRRAMISMLEKVRMSPATDAGCRALMLERIAHLRGH